MAPKRIQLQRKKGWKLPPNTVVVARPSVWGNPFSVHAVSFSARAAVKRFSDWGMADTEFLNLVRGELRGKNLACWCPLGKPCHADVLLKMANRPLASQIVSRRTKHLTPGWLDLSDQDRAWFSDMLSIFTRPEYARTAAAMRSGAIPISYAFRPLVSKGARR